MADCVVRIHIHADRDNGGFQLILESLKTSRDIYGHSSSDHLWAYGHFPRQSFYHLLKYKHESFHIRQNTNGKEFKFCAFGHLWPYAIYIDGLLAEYTYGIHRVACNSYKQ